MPAALEGAAALFAVPPVAFGPDGSGVEQEFARGRALIDAATAVGVEHVVFTGIASTPGRLGGSEGKKRIEDYLRERIRSVTVLRPVRFMSNYLAAPPVGVDGIVHGVHRHIFPPDEPVQIIAVEDIAEFASLAFDRPDRFAGRTLELAGDAPTPAEAVAAISEATGTAVRYEQITHAEAVALNPEIAQVRERWAAGSRWHADIEALRVIHPGLRTLADWLAESGTALLRKRLLETA
ncbi:NmrA family transcriptional regulator [Streptomyces sp. CNQ-509]|nr:NmrA family transcriptional regulator [Streptomyces sp. CNQ-509]